MKIYQNYSPLRFSDNEINKLQNLWTNHRSGLQEIAEQLKLPAHIKDAIKFHFKMPQM